MKRARKKSRKKPLALLLLVTSLTHVKGTELHNHEHRHTWAEADRICSQHGKSGMVTLTNSTETEVMAAMEDAEWKSTWLDMRREVLDQLHWPDGSLNQIPVEHDWSGSSPYKCGFLDTKSRKLSLTGCEEKRPGFICQFNDLRKCEERESESTFGHAGWCYKFYYGSKQMTNWQKAHERCRADGGFLAAIHSSDFLEVLCDMAMPYHGDSVEWWIGLSKAHYVNKFGEIPNIERWHPGQPNWNKKCVLMTKKAGLWYLKTAHCDRRHHFLCCKPGDGHKPEKRDKAVPKVLQVSHSYQLFSIKTTGKPEESPSHNQTWVVVLAAVPASIVAIAFFTFGFYKIYSWKKNCPLCGNGKPRTISDYTVCETKSEEEKKESI